jgi:hypothetical protein
MIGWQCFNQNLQLARIGGAGFGISARPEGSLSRKTKMAGPRGLVARHSSLARDLKASSSSPIARRQIKPRPVRSRRFDRAAIGMNETDEPHRAVLQLADPL